jgi:hypothetical protein
MMQKFENFDVKCMLCGAEVGQLLAGRFKKHAGCALDMPRRGGMLRCCHCSGSLYLDPIDVYPGAIDRAQLAKARAEAAA